MQTVLVGLDAASQFENFGYALGRLVDGRIEVDAHGLLRTRNGPNALRDVIPARLRNAERALVAIDAPLGWPDALPRALADHQAGVPLGFEKSELFRRATDRVVAAEIGKTPLEVAADRIARAAHSALEVLGLLRTLSGKQIPLAWSPQFESVAAIEVYPGATLKARGLEHSGYKKASDEEKAVRCRIAKALHAEIPILLSLTDERVDVFDACLCLVAAKDFLNAETLPPRNADLARREGWIWVRRPGE